MPIKRSLFLLLLAACSSGHLDAFTHAEPLGAGGALGGSVNSLGGALGQGGSMGGNVASGPLLLDDFEDGDTQTLIVGGWWYAKDSVGASVPLMSINPNALASRGSSGTHALRAWGSGCTGWCFLGLDLPGQPYLDARSYTRFSFWARAEASSVVRTITLDMLDGTNVDTPGNAVHFKRDIELTTEWTNFSIGFDELTPTTGSPTLRVDRSKLDSVEFWVFTTPDAFDFVLDDVALLP